MLFNHHTPQICDSLHNYSQTVNGYEFESGSTEQPPLDQNQLEAIFFLNFQRKYGYVEDVGFLLTQEVYYSKDIQN